MPVHWYVCTYVCTCRYKLKGELAEIASERSFQQALSVALEGDRIVLWAYDKDEVGWRHTCIRTYRMYVRAYIHKQSQAPICGATSTIFMNFILRIYTMVIAQP